jgi:lipopolysaccharide export system permease protein
LFHQAAPPKFRAPVVDRVRKQTSMMASIDRYIFRTIFAGFLLILINLTLVIWITQILRQVDLITNQGQTILVFLRITGLLVPILMLVIAPIALVIAVAYALTKLNGDSELVVMNAAGISPRRAFRPVFLSCLIVAIFVAYLSAFLVPWLQRQMAQEVAKVRTDVVSNFVRPGDFAAVDRGLIFHVREKRGENQFQGVFIDDTRTPDERVTIVAEYGQIVQRGGSAFMVMRDGNVERRRAKERDPAIVVFDQYAFDLTRLAPAPMVTVGLKEKYIWELAFPAPDDPIMKLSPAQFRVAFHERLYEPLYPLAFGIIAFAILGFPRTTRQSRTVSMFAVIAAVGALRLGGFAGTAVAVAAPAMLAVVYAVIALTIGLGGYVIWRGIPIDIDETLNVTAMVRASVNAAAWIAARLHLRLPDALRRLENPE